MSLSNSLQAIIDKLTRRTDGFDWLDKSYLIDWVVATGFWFIAEFINAWPAFERDFSPDDPLIGHPRSAVEQLSGKTNAFIAGIVPFALALSFGLYRRSLQEVHHGLLAIWSGMGLSRLITGFLKNRVGRLRPDFLARCGWDAALKTCTGDALAILDGRLSFPSGHSSTAFAGMTFVSLLLAGKTAAWCFSKPAAPSALLSSKLAALSLTTLPLAFATWVAVSRVEDYRHHKEDVIVGSIIGIASATVCYFMFWPSPFNIKQFTHSRTGRPRTLYTYNDDGMTRDELTMMENELESV